MSSWANRLIPRKRDLSQIPEAFRPVIVPRVERPEVILSESFQHSEKNELIYPVESDWKPQTLPNFSGYSTNSTSGYSNTYSSKRTIPAKELIHNEKTYVFVILRNIQKTSDNDLWLSCYHSIRQFYTNKIVIIDDNSSLNTVNGKLVNTEIIQSEFNGAGEILPYYYFQKEKWSDTMIFLHDSMILHRLFTDDELDHEVVFHWHFKETNDSTLKKTMSLMSSLTKNSVFEEYIKKHEWIGVFGGASIIDLSVVTMLEEKYKLSNIVSVVRTRKQRELVERILGIILSYEKQVTSNFGDILNYPYKFEANNTQTSIYNISQANYNTAIIKLWRGR
jgi:predicted DNA-binding protein (MmcQ/YjbR family)